MSNSSDQILRFKEVMSRVSLGRSSIYHLIKKGIFPRPIKLGERSVGWLETDIKTFLGKRVQERTEFETLSRGA